MGMKDGDSRDGAQRDGQGEEGGGRGSGDFVFGVPRAPGGLCGSAGRAEAVRASPQKSLKGRKVTAARRNKPALVQWSAALPPHRKRGGEEEARHLLIRLARPSRHPQRMSQPFRQ